MEIRYISLFSFWNLIIFKFGGKLFSKKKKKKKKVWWKVYFYYSLNLVSEITILSLSLTPIQIYLHKSMICQFSFIFSIFFTKRVHICQQ